MVWMCEDTHNSLKMERMSKVITCFFPFILSVHWHWRKRHIKRNEPTAQTSCVNSDWRVEKQWSHGTAGISLSKWVCGGHACHRMGVHSSMLLVSGSSHCRVQVHHPGADTADGAGMLPPSTQGLFWLHCFLCPFSCHSSLGFDWFSAVGTSPGLSQALLLPSGDAVLFRGGGDTQRLGAGNKGVVWICYG